MFLGMAFFKMGILTGQASVKMYAWNKSGAFNWLFALMRPVGQMAFNNYLMQSLLCRLFFYSIGMGMYGSYLVAAI